MWLPTAKKSPLSSVEGKLVTLQLSLEVGAIQLTMAPHWPGSLVTEMLAGTLEITGSSSSVTTTLKEAVAVFPAASVAV